MPKRTLLLLVGGLVVLSIALVLVLGLARLLAAMQDLGGAAVLDRIALGVGVFWLLDILCLVLALGLNSLLPPGE